MSRPVRPRRSGARKTPIRAALRADSDLLSVVKDGLGAVIDGHRRCFDESVRSSFTDSLDLDEALKKGREQENRWDYLLGHAPSCEIVAVEPHSADNSEISTVIRKVEAARRQLHGHLRDGLLVSRWLWVASGKVHFAPLEKATLRLAESGITFVGRKITKRHLR